MVEGFHGQSACFTNGLRYLSTKTLAAFLPPRQRIIITRSLPKSWPAEPTVTRFPLTRSRRYREQFGRYRGVWLSKPSNHDVCVIHLFSSRPQGATIRQCWSNMVQTSIPLDWSAQLTLMDEASGRLCMAAGRRRMFGILYELGRQALRDPLTRQAYCW